MRAMDAPDCNLLVVGKLPVVSRYDAVELSAAVEAGSRAATGGADAYLETLASEIVPAARKKSGEARRMSASPGISLAGLCALCDVPLRLLRVGGQHVRLPCGFEVPGNTCFGMN